MDLVLSPGASKEKALGRFPVLLTSRFFNNTHALSCNFEHRRLKNAMKHKSLQEVKNMVDIQDFGDAISFFCRS